jgi:hypothetical protein
MIFSKLLYFLLKDLYISYKIFTDKYKPRYQTLDPKTMDVSGVK